MRDKRNKLCGRHTIILFFFFDRHTIILYIGGFSHCRDNKENKMILARSYLVEIFFFLCLSNPQCLLTDSEMDVVKLINPSHLDMKIEKKGETVFITQKYILQMTVLGLQGPRQLCRFQVLGSFKVHSFGTGVEKIWVMSNRAL